MAPLTIWINRSYATSVHAIRLLRDNPERRPIRVIGSHVDSDSPVLTEVDLVVPEPDLACAAYAQQALELCQREQVDVIWPRWQAKALARAESALRLAGVVLVVAPADAIDRCEDKAEVYAALADRAVPIPEHMVVTTGAELYLATESLVHHEILCVKPTVGTGGDGFRILQSERLGASQLFGALSPAAAIDDVAYALDGPGAPALLVMPFLGGAEFSIDVLADHGTVLGAVVRRKVDGARRVEVVAAPQLVRIVTDIVSVLGLSSLANVQLREDTGGRVWLLEVNARASAGLYQTATVGWNLPWAAVQLALGERVLLPSPRLPAALVQVPTTLNLRP